MKHLKRFNESHEDKSPTLRDLIGDIKETKDERYRTITETTKGCFTDVELFDDNINLLDSEVTMYMYRGDNNVGEITLRHPDEEYGTMLYAYFENGIPKIISSYPGDERGCTLFNGTFIASGHDGNYLWNVTTGEFKSNTW